MNLDRLQQQCLDYLADLFPADAAHDNSHVRRVVKNVVDLTESEDANPLITLPSSWLHDCVAVA